MLFRSLVVRLAALGAVAVALLGLPGSVAALDPTTSTTVSSVNPSLARDNVTLTIRVTAAAGSPTPTGTVNVYDGATRLGTCTLTSGACTYAVTGLTVGSHGIVAQYLGDAAHDRDARSLVDALIAARILLGDEDEWERTPAVVNPHEWEDVIFVAAGARLFASHDRGGTWMQMADGLPAANAIAASV